MFSHNDIWTAIDRLADSKGYSSSGLAKKAGLDPTSFNKSKRISPDGKPRWPSTESIAKVLSVTDSTMSDLMSLMDEESPPPNSSHARMPSTLPVITFAQASQDRYFDKSGQPKAEKWDALPFPLRDAGGESTLAALKIHSDAATDLYRKGDVLIIAIDAEIEPGDRIVVKLKNGEIIAKTLMSKTSNRLHLRPLDQKKEDRAVRLSDIIWSAKVLWLSQ